MRSARILRILAWLAAVGLCGLAPSPSPAQQVTVGTPFNSVSDSFFEHFGTHWGFNWKGLHVNFGGPNMGFPQFGNFDPAGGIRGGFGVQGGDFNGFFNFSAGQGFRQSLVSQTPSLTLTNGYPGYFADVSQTPFVMGFIPVVGGFVDGPPIGYRPYYTTGFPFPMASMPPVPQGNPRVQAMLGQLATGDRPFAPAAAEPLLKGLPGGGGPIPGEPGWEDPIGGDPALEKLAGAQSSSAGRPVPSVAEARRMHDLEEAAAEAARNEEARVDYEKALTAEEAGNPGLAKIYYRMALKRANGELRGQILARLKAAESAETPQ